MFVNKIFIEFFTYFVPFIVLKMTVSISRFQCKNRVKKQTPLGREIYTPNQTTSQYLGWIIFPTDFSVETVCS